MSQCPATPGVTILPLCSPGPRLSSGSQCLHSREHAPPTLGLNPVLKGLALRLSTRAPGGSSLLARAGPHCRRRRHRRQSHGLFLTIWSPLLGCPLSTERCTWTTYTYRHPQTRERGSRGTPPHVLQETPSSLVPHLHVLRKQVEWTNGWVDGWMDE